MFALSTTLLKSLVIETSTITVPAIAAFIQRRTDCGVTLPLIGPRAIPDRFAVIFSWSDANAASLSNAALARLSR